MMNKHLTRVAFTIPTILVVAVLILSWLDGKSPQRWIAQQWRISSGEVRRTIDNPERTADIFRSHYLGGGQ